MTKFSYSFPSASKASNFLIKLLPYSFFLPSETWKCFNFFPSSGALNLRFYFDVLVHCIPNVTYIYIFPFQKSLFSIYINSQTEIIILFEVIQDGLLTVFLVISDSCSDVSVFQWSPSKLFSLKSCRNRQPGIPVYTQAWSCDRKLSECKTPCFSTWRILPFSGLFQEDHFLHDSI